MESSANTIKTNTINMIQNNTINMIKTNKINFKRVNMINILILIENRPMKIPEKTSK